MEVKGQLNTPTALPLPVGTGTGLDDLEKRKTPNLNRDSIPVSQGYSPVAIQSWSHMLYSPVTYAIQSWSHMLYSPVTYAIHSGHICYTVLVTYAIQSWSHMLYSHVIFS
jgi:hypothetical protein